MKMRFPRFFTGALLLAGLAVNTAEGIAPSGRYQVDTARGTVTDTKTKLTWQRVPAQSLTWMESKNYCEGLSTSIGGVGWRLPSVKELATLIDPVQQTPPFVDVVAFPQTLPDYFWTSTIFVVNPKQVWVVGFGLNPDGTEGGVLQSDVDTDGVPFGRAIRCVRSADH